MYYRLAFISLVSAAALMAGAGTSSAQTAEQRGETSKIFDTTTLTFLPEVLNGAPSSVIAINKQMRELAELVPARLRAGYFANMFQLNTVTPPALLPYEPLAERHRQLLLQAYYQLIPADQTVTPGTFVEDYFGIRHDPDRIGGSQAGSIADLEAVVKLWGDNGFVVKWLKEVGPTGPINGVLTVAAQPCFQKVTLNGKTYAVPKCEVAVAFDTPARTAARLWQMRLTMVESQKIQPITWTILPNAGMYTAKHPNTGADMPNSALTCVADNTYASRGGINGVPETHPGRVLWQLSAQLVASLSQCFAEKIPALAIKDNNNFRDPKNWRPLWPKNTGNPEYEGPLPPK